MSADLTPQAPSVRFTRGVRVGAVVYALLLAGFWVWAILEGADGPVPPLSLTLLAVVGVGLLGWPMMTLWRWAGQPRLTNDQQRELRWGLRGTERRALGRALRRGESPPMGLQAWALPYGRAQHQLVPGGCVLLLLGAASLSQAVADSIADTGPGFLAWLQFGSAVFCVVAGAAMLWWARRAASSTRRWAAGGAVAATGTTEAAR